MEQSHSPVCGVPYHPNLEPEVHMKEECLIENDMIKNGTLNDWMENMSDLSNMTTADLMGHYENTQQRTDDPLTLRHDLNTPQHEHEDFTFPASHFDNDENNFFFNSDNLKEENMRDLEVSIETRSDTNTTTTTSGNPTNAPSTVGNLMEIFHDETTIMDPIMSADNITPSGVTNINTVMDPTNAVTPVVNTINPTVPETMFPIATSNADHASTAMPSSAIHADNSGPSFLTSAESTESVLKKLTLNLDFGSFLKEEIATPDIVKMMQDKKEFNLLDYMEDDMQTPSAEAPSLPDDLQSIQTPNLNLPVGFHQPAFPHTVTTQDSDPLAEACRTAEISKHDLDLPTTSTVIAASAPVSFTMETHPEVSRPTKVQHVLIKRKPPVPAKRIFLVPTRKTKVRVPAKRPVETVKSNSIPVIKVQPTVSRSILSHNVRPSKRPAHVAPPVEQSTKHQKLPLQDSVDDPRSVIQRIKNNEASKRSRATRKQKTKDAELLVDQLEMQNEALRQKKEILTKLVATAKEAVAQNMRSVRQ